MENSCLLKMDNIHKKFPGVYALKGVDLELKAGEVHALLGENGAGKSTLMKVLAGIYKPDEGKIYLKGEPCNIHNVHDSQAKGISVIHQEICLVPYMSVADNFFLGREKAKTDLGFVNVNDSIKEAQQIIDSMNLNINAREKVANLSIAKQQMVEISKALLTDSEIIVMDEPTASLTKKEVDKLFETIAELKKKNIGIIYISHRMEELFAISDRVTVMRDGEYIGTKITKETSRDELITMMVGRELKDLYIKQDHSVQEEVLEVTALTKDKTLKNINFIARKGEILGISGIVGAGRTELAQVLFGIDQADSGTIKINGKEVNIKNPKDAMKHGIALVSENRKEEGLVLIQDVGYNISLTVLDEFMSGISTDKIKEDELIQRYIEDLAIKTPSKKQKVGNLSGGNQQKIVIAKWLATKPIVLILDEPTRGVDVGAKAEIYAIMNRLAMEGVCIIMISSELPEIINMSDRVLVMAEGEIRGELKREELEQEKIMNLATGGKR